MSLAFTVRKLDAGAVIASKRFQVDDQIKVYTLSLKIADYINIFLSMGLSDF